MNTKAVLIGIIVLAITISLGLFYLQRTPSVSKVPQAASLISPSEVKREIVQYPINPNKTIEVEAQKLPEFTMDVSDPKFEKILLSSKDELKKLVSVNIAHTYLKQRGNIDSDLAIDKKKKLLMVSAKDLANFKPGLYKVSLTLRAIEGEVNLEQDFLVGSNCS